ncbi:MAG: glycosyltransferase family 39 protein [Elusimicrobiales bacterium]|jgi:hypothetical protein|nr:glycosyltransferase family 39 protein [Elusimicrobiales bacterium]
MSKKKNHKQPKELVVEKKEKENKKLYFLAFAVFIVISYFTFSAYFSKFPFSLLMFVDLINPSNYLSSNITKTVGYNTLEIIKIILFLISVIGWGRLVVKILRLDVPEKEGIVASYVLGLCAIAIFTMATGFAGFIKRPLYLSFLSVGILLYFLRLYKNGFKLSLSFKDDIKSNKLLFFIFFVIFVINLVQSLAPEIFYDTLVYHLGVPNYWLIEGSIKDMPYNIYSKLTLNHSFIYLFSLVSFGKQNPLLINFISSVFCFISIGWLFRKHISAKTSLLAAVIFYSIFHVAQSSQAAASDIIAALFIIVAFYSAVKYLDTKKLIWMGLCGLFSGFAFGTKYNTAFIIISFLVVVVYKKIKDKEFRFNWFLKEIAIFSVFFAIFTVPWFIKNYINYSNPLYPFGISIFNKNIPTLDAEKINNFMLEVRQFSSFNFTDWLKHPFLISTGQIINSEFFTPLFLLILPLAIFKRNKNYFIRYLWIVFIFSWIMWSFSSTTIRHLFSSFFAMSILAAYYINDVYGGILKKLMKFAAYLTIFLSITWIIYLMRSEGRYRVVNGEISRDDYLSETHPRYPSPSYALFKYINENLKSNEKVLILGDSKSFYLDKPFEVSSVFDRNQLIDITIGSKDGDEVYKKLKEKGITHILLNVTEAFRTQKGYSIFYWGDEDMKKYDDFFNKHLSEEKTYEKIISNQYSEKLVLYRIVDRNKTIFSNYLRQVWEYSKKNI